MKNFIKKNGYYLLTFMIIFIILLIVFIKKEIAPFGDNCLLAIDFYHQYGPMLGEMHNRVYNGRNILYTFQQGLGLPIFGNFFNYLSSPFNILIFLFPYKSLLTSFSFVIGFKIILMALFMAYFLDKKFGRKYSNVAISILYALNAYLVAFYWNIMWLDGMVFLPLITLGIEVLIDKDKMRNFIIPLVIMIFSNYYIAYMICIYSFLYFVTYLIIKTDKFDIKLILKKITKFALSGIISVLLCAFFLIPLFVYVRGISSVGGTIPSVQYYLFSLKEFIFNHFSGVGNVVFSTDVTNAPNVSTGILSIALVCLFWQNSKINLKTKICYTVLMGFFIFSFFSPFLDFIWHGFHVPNDLPYRYSFIYIFILLVMSAYSINKIKDAKISHGINTFIIGIITLFMMKELEFLNIDLTMINVNFIFITILFIIFLLYKKVECFQKYCVWLIILLASFDGYLKINNNWNIDTSVESYYNEYDTVEEIIDEIKENDDGYYRVEKSNNMTLNDPSFYGYNGMNSFSSMQYFNLAILEHNLGIPGNEINSFYYRLNTPVYHMMFNLKYIIDGVDEFNYFDYENNVSTFKYNLGYAFGVNENIKNWVCKNIDPIVSQNSLIELSTGIDHVFEKMDGISSETIYKGERAYVVKYTINNIDENFYFYLKNPYLNFIYASEIMYYRTEYPDYLSDYASLPLYDLYEYNEPFIINVMPQTDPVEILVGYFYGGGDEIKFYKLNHDKFIEAYKILSKNKLEINTFNDSIIEGTLNAHSNLTVFTSIPFDQGWNVYVDGEKVDTFKISNALLGFDVSMGTHVIRMEYHIPYLELGIGISSLTGLSLIIFFTKNKRLWKYKRKKVIKTSVK